MSLRIGNRLNGASLAELPGLADGAARASLRQAAVAIARNAYSAGADRMVMKNAPGSDPDAAAKAQIQETFKNEFGAKAANKAEFDAFMKQVFGDKYDAAMAEEFRQKALAGDYSWLPKIEFVDRSTLQGGNGAYNAEDGVVYIASDLKSNPALAGQVYVEEAGAYLDQQVNHGADTIGDEGEMFRRVLSGEKLSQADMAEIKADDDHGTITVNGKQIAVEFWNPFKAVANAVKKVGGAIVDGVKKVGGAIVDGVKKVGGAIVDGVKKVGGWIVDGVKGVGKGLFEIGKGIFDGVKTFGEGLFEGVGGFVKNLVKGKFKQAFKSLGAGLDKAFLQAPSRLVNGALNGVESIVDGATRFLGPLGGPVRFVTSRVMDAGRSIITGAVDTVTGMVRNTVEAGSQFLGGVGKFVTGDFKGGLKDMGMGLLKGFIQTPVDGILMGGGRAISAIQTLTGLEKPGRRLTDAEIAELKKVYGDTIDYSAVRIKEGFAGVMSLNDRPFTHGNTIYLKDDKSMATLVHEMAHIWQGQNGGTDYMSEALLGQKSKEEYDWTLSAPAKAFDELNPEQQAQLMEDAFKAGFFNNPTGTFTFDANENGRIDAGEDYTDYLNAALAQVRAGEGAP